MKIHFICSPVSGNGGIETVLSEVIRRMSLDYDISLTLLNNPGNQSWLKKLPQKINISYPSSTAKLKLSGYLARTFSRINNDDQVIILGANILKLAYFYKKICFKKWNIISWIHYSLKDQNMFNPHNLLYADYHLAISSSIRDQMIELGIPKEKIYLIFNPISKKRETNISPKSNKIKLVFIGHITLNGQKNLKELFDGIKEYNNNYSKLTLDIFGSPDEIDACKKYARSLNIEQEIRWHFWTNDPWKIILTDIKPNALILTSKFEGLPMVALEALSYGVPCITSNFKGFSDIVKDGKNGLYYHQGNVKELAYKINQLANITFNPKMVKQSIEFYYENNYYKKLKESLEKIIKNN
ncbi:glycosyltransferase [Limosilactobacillus vaginalis]|uniref:glycosyltransferase n=1 Tax=Limosilactobacillus vaginalis TaxID=1633 RepID=UPI0021B603E5|nr:glycosyltransferase [Limosilactobacillus vaginalis]UXC68811.1 glycosyltransferase [Limosilactobacillus vaginalis]